MNKILIHFKGIIICLSIFCFLACTGGSSSGNPEQLDSIDIEVDYAPTKSGAISAAQSFIRREFASNAEFESEGTIVEETGVPGRFKVLQKFTAEDHPSGLSTFIYRIWVQRFDDGIWEFGNLGIESVTGERVLTTNGNMKEREQTEGVGDKITAGGIEFTIAERKPTAIRIYTKDKLSVDKMRNAIKDLMGTYENIQFSTDAKHERGDEYACWASGIFCNFDTNEVISKDKFFK